MRLDSNFYKKETTELSPEISRRREIESYLITRYGIDHSFAQRVSIVLDRVKLDVRDICVGRYDSVIEFTIEDMRKDRVSSLNDARYIRESETKERLYSDESSNNQTQPQISQQQNVQFTEEQIKQFEEEKAKYIQMMQEQRMKADELRARIMARRGKR